MNAKTDLKKMLRVWNRWLRQDESASEKRCQLLDHLVRGGEAAERDKVSGDHARLQRSDADPHIHMPTEHVNPSVGGLVTAKISYNFALPFEGIPDDLVPLTAHFKHLLTMATEQQPLLLFLDSVDQLTGIGTENNKVSWLPTRLPPHCKIIVTCACEEANPEVSKEYDVLRRMIDSEESFLEVKALGEDLAMQVLNRSFGTSESENLNYLSQFWQVSPDINIMLSDEL
ncbi:hypothetical protein EVAR_81834_1 [Eumeta japonica]|uniref:Uncharacterized protein n=1 Tax=Eumeta variegata TaxID=151549 RepID=A0A4C1XVC5_EUMVA|nr:hypothetical protein EVAR_81834_1 [Eumeta japonica]